MADTTATLEARCPDCQVVIGAAHQVGCDVARCLHRGRQRLSCPAGHDCGQDTWTGRWPGDTDCERLGWYARFVPNVAWLPCRSDHPDAQQDLNRLHRDAVWNRHAQRWELDRRAEPDDVDKVEAVELLTAAVEPERGGVEALTVYPHKLIGNVTVGAFWALPDALRLMVDAAYVRRVTEPFGFPALAVTAPGRDTVCFVVNFPGGTTCPN